MAFTLVTNQIIVARNAGALYNTTVGTANMAIFVNQAGTDPDALLNSIYNNSVDGASPEDVAAALIANAGITGAAVIADATAYIVAHLNAVPVADRGAEVNNILDTFANLGLTDPVDPTYGVFATAFNDKVANAVAYASVPGNVDTTFDAVPVTPGEVPGSTFTLTFGADTFTPTSNEAGHQTTVNADTIRAITADSLESVDNIDGGNGNDTLNIADGAIAAAAAPILVSVETVNITDGLTAAAIAAVAADDALAAAVADDAAAAAASAGNLAAIAAVAVLVPPADAASVALAVTADPGADDAIKLVATDAAALVGADAASVAAAVAAASTAAASTAAATDATSIAPGSLLTLANATDAVALIAADNATLVLTDSSGINAINVTTTDAGVVTTLDDASLSTTFGTALSTAAGGIDINILAPTTGTADTLQFSLGDNNINEALVTSTDDAASIEAITVAADGSHSGTSVAGNNVADEVIFDPTFTGVKTLTVTGEGNADIVLASDALTTVAAADASGNNNFFFNGAHDKTVSTGSGNDDITTGLGPNISDDIINSGAGNDTIAAGGGVNTYNGGLGADEYFGQGDDNFIIQTSTIEDLGFDTVSPLGAPTGFDTGVDTITFFGGAAGSATNYTEVVSTGAGFVADLSAAKGALALNDLLQYVVVADTGNLTDSFVFFDGNGDHLLTTNGADYAVLLTGVTTLDIAFADITAAVA